MDNNEDIIKMEVVLTDYKNYLKEAFQLDDLTIAALGVESERMKKMSLIQRHPFLFHGLLSIISNLLYPFWGLNRKVHLSNEDFVFISSTDPVFRTKNIGLITGNLSYSIIHLPNFHIKQAKNYDKYFKNQNIKAFFPTISLFNVLKARKQLKRFSKACTLNQKANEYKVMECVLSIFLIYDNVVKDVLRNYTEFNGKWILEHQIYFYAPVVFNLRSLGKKTTMLQHGLFFKPTMDFFPLNCDKVLCCSEREKKIYIREGVEEERVKVLGIPLQTLTSSAHQKREGREEKEYNLLLLLSIVTDANVSLIKEILRYIQGKYDKVLLRFRPRSRDKDMIMLGDSIDSFAISDQGHTIVEDLQRSKNVITFSADAIVEIVKVNSPFLYIWLKEYQDFIKEIDCATMDNYKEKVDQLMNSEIVTNKMQEMAVEMVGEQNIEIIKSRFVDYIQSRP